MSSPPNRPPRGWHAPVGLLLLLLVSTLGEGGAEPLWLAVWHGLLLVLLVAAWLLTPVDAAERTGLARAPLAGYSLFLVIALTQAAFAPYAFAAWLVLLELGAFMAVAWLAARCASAVSSWAPATLGLAAALQLAVMIWQKLTASVERPAGTFLNENHLAGWLVAVLLLGLGQALDGGRVRRRLGAAVAAIATLGLALASSRGALVGLGAGIATLAALGWSRMTPARRRASLAIGVVLLLVAGWTVALRLTDQDPFRYNRLGIWKATAAMVVDAPWVGRGPGQFAAATANFRFPDGLQPFHYDRSFSSPHSDLLRLVGEFGGLGALALLFAAGATVGVVRSRRRAGELGGVAAGSVAGLVALGAHALVDDLTHRPAVYLLAAVLLGCVLARSRPAPPRSRLPARAGLVLLLATGYLAADLGPYLGWRAMAGLAQAPSPAERAARLQRALRLNPLQPHGWLLEAQRLAADRSAWDVEHYAAAREAAERAIRLQPVDARFALGLARVEALGCRTLFRDEGSRERARQAYERAEALSLFDPFIPIELAQFLIDTDDPAGARGAAERALALEPEAVLPRLVLADALLASDHEPGADRALRLLEEAREKAGRWAGAASGEYATRLLRLDPQVILRLEREARQAAESG